MGIGIDPAALERELGVPVVAASARRDEGMDALREAIRAVARGERVPSPVRVPAFSPEVEPLVAEVERAVRDAQPERHNARWIALRLLNADDRVEGTVPPEALEVASAVRWRMPPDFHDRITAGMFAAAEGIASRVQLTGVQKVRFDLDRALDRWLTSPVTGFPLMVVMLAVVFWLTIAGANVPSAMLATLLVDNVHPMLRGFAEGLGMPWWIIGVTIDGVYLATAWVISGDVAADGDLLPAVHAARRLRVPAARGVQPRRTVPPCGGARQAGAHHVHGLRLQRGGCGGHARHRQPRERLVAIITNNFSLCNGRWPTQILMASIFVGALVPPAFAGLVSATAVVAIALIGMAMMFFASWLLTRTVLKR